jgi:hypothetical protein
MQFGKIVRTALPGFLCLSALCGILCAGLWPFHAPKNDVSWSTGSGLLFGENGTILSSTDFPPAGQNSQKACTLEIWLQAGVLDDANTFLAFYNPQNPFQFTLHQSNVNLDIQRQTRNNQQTSTSRIYIGKVFRPEKPSFITVTATKKDTAVYIDGVPAANSGNFGLNADDFTGQLVVGNSAVENDSWSGYLRGLAIYTQALTPEQVRRHYETWTGTRSD